MVYPKLTIPIHNFLQGLRCRGNPVSVVMTEITDAMLRTGCRCCVVFVKTAENTYYRAVFQHEKASENRSL